MAFKFRLWFLEGVLSITIGAQHLHEMFGGSDGKQADVRESRKIGFSFAILSPAKLSFNLVANRHAAIAHQKQNACSWWLKMGGTHVVTETLNFKDICHTSRMCFRNRVRDFNKGHAAVS